MEPPGNVETISEAEAEERRRGWPLRQRRLQQWPQEKGEDGEDEEGAGAERPPCVFCRCDKCRVL